MPELKASILIVEDDESVRAIENGKYGAHSSGTRRERAAMAFMASVVTFFL